MAKKKRYYQSGKDRMSESRGMERYETENMEKRDERRRELEDSYMIHEDCSAPSNLPQNVIMKMYAKGPYPDFDISDTISGIDMQIYNDSEERKQNRYKTGKYPNKY